MTNTTTRGKFPMKRISKLSVSALAGTIVASVLAFSAPASAAVTVTLAKSSSLVDGEKITVTLAGIPAGQGVYVQQCYQPKVGTRAATGLKCSGSLQQTDLMIWATMDSARGSQPATAPLTFTVRRNVTTASETLSCGMSDCAIFVFRDHRGITDTSLDTVVPLTFLVDQTLKLRAMGFPKPDSEQKVGASLNLSSSLLRTDQSGRVRVVSTNEAVCQVNNGGLTTTVRFAKRGRCSLQLIAKSDAKYLRLVFDIAYKVR
jgi:hypothetical protein